MCCTSLTTYSIMSAYKELAKNQGEDGLGVILQKAIEAQR